MKIKEELNKHKKLLAATAIILLALAATVVAVTIVTAPEHVIGTPLNPEPTPTPTPTPEPAALHLTSNVTDPFYKGDSLEMTATLTPAQSGIVVTLYNNGNVITTAETNASGIAVFVRQPTNPFDYTVSAELP